jgi:hypothetical protein
VSRESARWAAGGVPRFLCRLRFFQALRIGGAGAGRRARQRRRCDMHARGTAAVWLANNDMRERRPLVTVPDAVFLAERVVYESVARAYQLRSPIAGEQLIVALAERS